MQYQCLNLELIAAFLDGNATAVEREAIEKHITHCDDCRKLVAFVVKSETQIPNVPLPVPPDSDFTSE